MNSKSLSQRAINELEEQREEQAVCALKASHLRVMSAERHLEEAQAEHRALCKAIDNGSFNPPSPPANQRF